MTKTTISNNVFDGDTTYSPYCNGYAYWAFIFTGSGDQLTFALNHIYHISGRGPHVGGTSGYYQNIHIFNNYYSGVSDGINTRDGAQLLVENNVFVSSKKALYSTDEGFADAKGNDFGNSENTAPEGRLTSVDYEYTLPDTTEVASSVQSSAGQTLDFSA